MNVDKPKKLQIFVKIIYLIKVAWLTLKLQLGTVAKLGCSGIKIICNWYENKESNVMPEQQTVRARTSKQSKSMNATTK